MAGALMRKVLRFPTGIEVRLPVSAWAMLVARSVLGALFLWAAALKFSHPRAFAQVIDEYGIVPGGWPLVIAAFAIPALEAFAGLGVLLDRRAGWWLMLGFTNVARYVGGIKSWVEADYPVGKGSE